MIISILSYFLSQFEYKNLPRRRRKRNLFGAIHYEEMNKYRPVVGVSIEFHHQEEEEAGSGKRINCSESYSRDNLPEREAASSGQRTEFAFASGHKKRERSKWSLPPTFTNRFASPLSF